MGSQGDEAELKALSDIYDVLKGDARQIVADLQDGVMMWREAAAGALASAGFLVILALTYIHGGAGNPLDFWGAAGLTAFEALASGLAAMMGAIGVIGLWRYFKLRKKYAPLFAKAAKLG
jgi:hypothetical protein